MPHKAAATSTPASAKGHKRLLSTGTPSTATPGSRASKRLKESVDNTCASTTPKKSKYFEDPDSDEDDDVESSSVAAEESAFDEDEEIGSETPPSEEDSETEYDSEEDEKPKRRRSRPTPKKSVGVVAAIVDTGKNLWREGVKAGLGPGKQIFIAKPKPRDDGGIKYVPEMIHPNTMAFLSDLKKNNDRQWLKMHDPDYRQSWKDWESFVETLSEKISEVDETVPELPPKDLVFRIYRDVRFSSDPTPYKTHFSAAFSRTGRKGPYACYYVQVSPNGQSFVGGGLWMPEAQQLALMRRDIDRHPERFKRVLTDAGVRKHLLNGIANDEKKAVKAFASSNQENALKTKPKVRSFICVKLQALKVPCMVLVKLGSIVVGPNDSMRFPSDQTSHLSCRTETPEKGGRNSASHEGGSTTRAGWEASPSSTTASGRPWHCDKPLVNNKQDRQYFRGHKHPVYLAHQKRFMMPQS